MKKKLVLSLAAAAMVGTLAVGGTLAWFTDTETAKNVVTTGNVNISWIENGKEVLTEEDGVKFGKDKPVVPNSILEKVAYVQNKGKNDALIRVKAIVDSDISEYVTVGYNEDTPSKWEQDGEWYYYTEVVKAGDKTEDFIRNLTIPAEVGNAVANITEANVELRADAIQADEISEAIKEGNYTVEDIIEAFEGKNIVDYETKAAEQAEPAQ